MKTTVPFFQWLVGQPEFLDGRVRHDVSRSRARRARRAAVRRADRRATSDDAVVAAALAAWLRAASRGRRTPPAPTRRRVAAQRRRTATGLRDDLRDRDQRPRRGRVSIEPSAAPRARRAAGFACASTACRTTSTRARPTSGCRWSIADDGRSVDVAVTERAAGEWLAAVSARRLSRRPSTAAASGAAGRRRGRGDGEQRITAPMPGRIVRVLVKTGRRGRRAARALVVVEAMKMENELVAPRAGRVKEVVGHRGPVGRGRPAARRRRVS